MVIIKIVHLKCLVLLIIMTKKQSNKKQTLPSSSYQIFLLQILASQLYSQTAKVYEPETAEINSNVATSPNCSLTVKLIPYI